MHGLGYTSKNFNTKAGIYAYTTHVVIGTIGPLFTRKWRFVYVWMPKDQNISPILLGGGGVGGSQSYQVFGVNLWHAFSC